MTVKTIWKNATMMEVTAVKKLRPVSIAIRMRMAMAMTRRSAYAMQLDYWRASKATYGVRNDLIISSMISPKRSFSIQRFARH